MSYDISPARDFAAVTPSDTDNNLLLGNGKPPKGIYVGGAGDLVAVNDGNAVTFSGVPVGTVLSIRPDRINATGTTATNMVALY